MVTWSFLTDVRRLKTTHDGAAYRGAGGLRVKKSRVLKVSESSGARAGAKFRSWSGDTARAERGDKNTPRKS